MLNAPQILELAACSNRPEAADQVARALGGTLYHDERERYGHLPFRAMVTATTDSLASLEHIADVGLYLVCRRLLKQGDARVAGLFPLLRQRQKTHEQADAHWRDIHAPLALEHHAHMCHYSQLSVLHRFSGLQLDGMAVCGFDSVQSLRERFYTSAASTSVIAADVAQFADVERSPARLIARVTVYGAQPMSTFSK